METSHRAEAAPRVLADASPAQVRNIKQRLMNRVADADTSHLTVQADEGEWLPFCEGVQIKVLREGPEVVSYLLKLAAGAKLPAHRHPQDEECVVLEGRLQIGSRLDIGPGSYHLAHAGALHAVVASREGATLFLRGAVPHLGQVLA